MEAGFDHLNLHKLVDFCERSKLPQKLVGFKPVVAEVNPLGGLQSLLKKVKTAAATQDQPSTEESNPTDEYVGGSPLMTLVDFMRSLSSPCEDGRVIFSRKTVASKSYFKYLVLNPASLFKDLVNEPR